MFFNDGNEDLLVKKNEGHLPRIQPAFVRSEVLRCIISSSGSGDIAFYYIYKLLVCRSCLLSYCSVAFFLQEIYLPPPGLFI